MSAISKPLVHFTGAITADQNKFVPVEYVQSVESFTVNAFGGNPAKYQLLFKIVYPQSDTKDVYITFATSTLRDTTLANYKLAMSTAVAGT